MPTQSIIPVTPGVGLDLDAVSLTIGPNTVFREVLVIADPTSPTELATVSGGALSVFLPSGQITTLTPPTAAAIASAIVANPPTTFSGVVTNAGTFAVQATLAGGSAVIGHVIVDSGTITAVTAITNALPAGTNVIGHVIVDSGAITASIAASQTIAVTNVGTFAVQATLATETTKVIGTIRVLGNVGGVMDTTLGSPKPANVLQVGGNDGTNAYAIPLAASGTSVVVSGTVTATVASATVVGTLSNNNAAPSTNNVGALTAVANANPPTNTEGDLVVASQDLAGSRRVRPGSPTTANWQQAVINFSTSGANIIIAGVGGQTIRVMRMFFVNSDATNATVITIQDTTVTSFSGPFRLISSGSFNGTDANGEPLFVTASGKGFQLNSSAAVQVSGTIWYTIS